jgi:adenosylcobinamide-GDP ribazoletransferase
MAARYLTIVPIPGSAPAREAPGAAAGWFPVVGFVIGAMLVIVDGIATSLFVPLLAALVTVTAWKLVTGGLHLDGLADCLDGLMGRDAEQRLAIMRDSRIGAFAAIGLVLVLLLEIAAVSGIASPLRWRALLVAPVVGRAMPPLVARAFPAAGAGQGRDFRAGVRASATVAATIFAFVVAVAALGPRGGLAFLLAAGVAMALGAFMTRRLGGVSGDVHGAAVELAELAVLLTIAAHPSR